MKFKMGDRVISVWDKGKIVAKHKDYRDLWFIELDYENGDFFESYLDQYPKLNEEISPKKRKILLEY